MKHDNTTERSDDFYPTLGEDFLNENFTTAYPETNTTYTNPFSAISKVELVLLSVIYALIFVVGVVGNLLVGVVMLKVRRMRSPTNYLLLNLSVADLLVLLVCVPSAILETWVVSPWLLGEFMCYFVPYVEFVTYHASTLTIIAIAVERYYAICQPLSCRHILSGSFIVRILVVLWVAAFVTSSPVVYVTKFHNGSIDGEPGEMAASCHLLLDTFGGQLYLTASAVVFYFAPLAILSGLYVIISRHLRGPDIHQSIRQRSAARLRLESRRQVTHMLLAVAVVFFLCLLPYRTVLLLLMYATTTLAEGLGMVGLWRVMAFCRVMAFINSTVNPVLYNLTSSKFRLAFKVALCCDRNDLEHTDRGTDGLLSYNSTRMNHVNVTSAPRHTSNDHRCMCSSPFEMSEFSRSRHVGNELIVTDSV